MMDKKRLEEIQRNVNYAYRRDGSINTKAVTMHIEHYEHLYEQAERVEGLENRKKELEYASKHNGELNVFLQKRKLPPNTLGRHVVDVVMNYVEELEREIEGREKFELGTASNLKILREQNKRYREAIEKTIEEIKHGYSDIAERNLLEALEAES